MSPSPPRSAAKILVVDDHPANLLAVEAVLEPLGRPIVRASSGEEALRKLLHEDFALILMDVQMPGLDGFHTVSMIRDRERSRSTPVIFLTAISRLPEHVLRGYETGAVDYIIKPFEPAILRAKAAVFLELQEARERTAAFEAERRQHERLELEAVVLRRFQRMMDAMPHCVWAMRRDGTSYYVNESARAFVGAGRAELSLCDPLLVHDDDLPRMRLAWDEWMHRGERGEIEVRMRRHDGVVRWLRLLAVPEREGPLGTSGWLVTGVDVDALHNMLLAKDDFIAAASHELRTPLAAARVQADLAVRHVQMAAPQKLDRALEHVRDQLRRMTELVNELLDVASVQQGNLRLEPADVDLIALARTCIDRVGALGDRHTFTLDAPDSLGLRADGSRLEQVITNLLANAVRYSPDGGPVEVQLAREADQVRISVRDQGLGIPREKLQTIFERFGRAHGGRYGGLGLGLAIARALVELHHGSLDVESEGVPGRGSVFHVRLPTAPPDEAPSPAGA